MIIFKYNLYYNLITLSICILSALIFGCSQTINSYDGPDKDLILRAKPISAKVHVHGYDVILNEVEIKKAWSTVLYLYENISYRKIYKFTKGHKIAPEIGLDIDIVLANNKSSTITFVDYEILHVGAITGYRHAFVLTKPDENKIMEFIDSVTDREKQEQKMSKE
jgi:hypothetical protein